MSKEPTKQELIKRKKEFTLLLKTILDWYSDNMQSAKLIVSILEEIWFDRASIPVIK